jgi:hypothetical protein
MSGIRAQRTRDEDSRWLRESSMGLLFQLLLQKVNPLIITPALQEGSCQIVASEVSVITSAHHNLT